MAEDVKPPVKVTIVDTGDHGDQTLVNGLIAKTPVGKPNVVLTVVGPSRAMFIRFANTFLTVLVGLITAGLATDIIPAADFFQLVVKCGQLSVASAGLGLLKDLVTIFGRLESKYPLLTGSV